MPFPVWMGICKVPRCNRLKILVPKHLLKSKIGPIQLILASKRYVTFFLGHPVHWQIRRNTDGYWWFLHWSAGEVTTWLLPAPNCTRLYSNIFICTKKGNTDGGITEIQLTNCKKYRQLLVILAGEVKIWLAPARNCSQRLRCIQIL